MPGRGELSGLVELKVRIEKTHDSSHETDSEGSGSTDETGSRSDSDETSENTRTQRNGRVTTGVDPEKQDERNCQPRDETWKKVKKELTNP